MNNPKKLRVFLCHGKEDKAPVRELHAQLKSDGFEPWLDEIDLLPGQEWRPTIEAAIRSSDVVLACLSDKSVGRAGFIQAEISLALDVFDLMPPGTIFLIPVRLSACEVPARLEKFQWVDLTPDGYEQIKRALNARADPIGRPSRSSTPPVATTTGIVSPPPNGFVLTIENFSIGATDQGRGAVTSWLVMSNVGPPSIAKQWALYWHAETRTPELLHSPPLFGNLTLGRLEPGQPPVVVKPEDAIHRKGMAPVPTGGLIQGVLFGVSQRQYRDMIRERAVLRVTCEDILGREWRGETLFRPVSER